MEHQSLLLPSALREPGNREKSDRLRFFGFEIPFGKRLASDLV
jgi:hypothetical protein